MGDVVRVVLTDAAGVVLLGAPEVGCDILFGLVVVASAGAQHLQGTFPVFVSTLTHTVCIGVVE